jgi:hypothetical protein
MSAESRLPWIVFAVLATLVALPFVLHEVRSQLRPRLVGARIVTATDADPVLRTGARVLASDEPVRIAVALRVDRRGRQPGWVAPSGPLEIDGRLQDGPRWESWPEDDRQVRVFWFTVECATVGGEIAPSTAAPRLAHRTFLAPEMGRDLLAAGFPSQHNDDALGPRLDGLPTDGGTARLYARAELVERLDAVRPLVAVTTTAPARFAHPDFPRVQRQADLGPGVDPAAGELFRLPGFELAGGLEPDAVLPGLGVTMAHATTRRLALSSWTFAAVAVAGQTALSPTDLSVLGRLTTAGGRMLLDGRPLIWDRDVRPGDVVFDGDQWIVLLGDEGDSELDAVDPVVHCFRGPPTRTRLGLVVADTGGRLELLRHGE